MKRALMVVALLAVGLAAFGQSLASVDPSGATITYWYQHATSKDTAMKALIAEFNTNNPWGITVQGEYAGGYNDIYNKMVAAIAANKPPDLVVAYQNQAAGYQVSDALTNLEPYVKDPKWGLGRDYADYVAGFITQDVNKQFGGQRLGFPPNRSIEVMYYNITWLKALGATVPPVTWPAFEALCKKATNTAKGTYGYSLDPFDASHLYAFVVSFGGEIAKPDGTGYQFNTPQMKSVMTLMKRLYDGGYAKKNAKQYDYQNEFGNSQALFSISSTSGINYYDSVVKASKAPFDWSVAAVPQAVATAKPAIDLYGASVSVPKTTPEKQLAAWLFIKWFSEPEQQARWAVISGYFPVRKAAEPLLKDYLAKNKIYAAGWKLLNSASLRSEPPYAGYDLVRDKELAAYNAILDGKDIATTLADLDVQAAKIYKDSSP
jgi:multiple sugar transport system substrate-binding protein